MTVCYITIMTRMTKNMMENSRNHNESITLKPHFDIYLTITIHSNCYIQSYKNRL